MKRDTIPTHMPTNNRPINDGVSLADDASRLDAVAKVTGAARYGRDMYLPNGLFAAFIRCPYGAATLQSIDVEAAEAVKGVVEVSLDDRREGTYQGQNVGYVLADSLQSMRRGLRALNATWRRDSVDTEIEHAMEEAPEPNAETQALLEQADHVLEAVYSTPVQTHSSLETHGAVVDHRGDEATVYSSTQGTFAARDGLDDAIGLSQNKYEVVCEYVGGGFGSKLNGAGKEGVTAARLSAKYTRPVHLFVTRAEDHVDTGNRPSSRSQVRVGFNKDGRILGGQVRTWGGVGVGRGGGGVTFPSGKYDLGSIDKSHQDVRLNAGAPRPFRAPGRPQGAFAEELMLDEIAATAGIDPLDLRMNLDVSADRRKMLKLGAKLIGWDQRASGPQSGTIRRGFGIGATEWGRFPAGAQAEVVVHRDGSVESRSGTQDIGTGQRTVMAIVAATNLGVPLEAVRSRVGRSSLPPGPGSGGSVTAANSSPAMAEAAVDARQQLLSLVADRLGVEPDAIELSDGVVRQGSREVMSWSDACALIGPEGITGRGRWDRAKLGRDPTTGHSEGVQFVDLRVDTETGVVHVDHIVAIQACGQVVYRKGAESQIIGAVIQGVSYALFERKILDRNVGAMINPNLEMYKVLGTMETPHIEPVLWRNGQTGVRPLGEPPTIPTSGAIACAVYNAIGVPVRHLPLTPDRVLGAMEGAAS